MLGRRDILADFDGGDITSDGAALLLRKVEELTGILRRFAICFTDHRDPDLIEHTVEHYYVIDKLLTLRKIRAEFGRALEVSPPLLRGVVCRLECVTPADVAQAGQVFATPAPHLDRPRSGAVGRRPGPGPTPRS